MRTFLCFSIPYFDATLYYFRVPFLKNESFHIGLNLISYLSGDARGT